MTIAELIQHYSTPIDQEIEQLLSDQLPLYTMIRYQLGWVDAEGNPVEFENRSRFGGKKLRGTLCLLAAEAVSGEYQNAIPAASAVEMIHNFSLVHDDVEDHDAERRHRPTVWKVWGVPQAINTGSSMQALSTLAGLRTAERGVDSNIILKLVHLLTTATLKMTEGQHLDMSFESREVIHPDEYYRMTSLKTGALLEASLGSGALVGGASESIQALYQQFGLNFGLAFQARDDYLGIWGDPVKTGKPVGSDILAKKKNLPLAYALNQTHGAEQEQLKHAIAEGNVDAVMKTLYLVDAKAYTIQIVSNYTSAAKDALDKTGLSNPAHQGLWQIAEYALTREK